MASGNVDLHSSIAMTLGVARLAILLSISVLLSVSPCTLSSAADGERWSSYEPAVVQLGGTLIVEKRFGPPNYGEDPATDAQLRIPMLLLASPVNVRGDPNDDLNNTTVTGVRKIQLIFLTGGPAYKRLIGKSVVVAGTLSQAMTGHHFTPVVLTVSEVREER